MLDWRLRIYQIVTGKDAQRTVLTKTLSNTMTARGQGGLRQQQRGPVRSPWAALAHSFSSCSIFPPDKGPIPEEKAWEADDDQAHWLLSKKRRTWNISYVGVGVEEILDSPWEAFLLMVYRRVEWLAKKYLSYFRLRFLLLGLRFFPSMKVGSNLLLTPNENLFSLSVASSSCILLFLHSLLHLNQLCSCMKDWDSRCDFSSSLENPLWLLFGNLIFYVIKSVVGESYFIVFLIRAWVFYDKNRAHLELGNVFVFVTPTKDWLYVGNAEALTEILQRRDDFPWLSGSMG